IDSPDTRRAPRYAVCGHSSSHSETSGVHDPRGRWVSKDVEVDVTKDPVCGMLIDEKKAAAKTQYEGQTYYFCSQECKDAFMKSPEAYVSRADARLQPSQK